MDERALRDRLVGEGLAPSTWGNGPLEQYPEHRHAYDKVLVAAAGSITFHLPELDRDVDLKAGDRLELSAGTLHGADVGDRGVTCLEAHLEAGKLGQEPKHIKGWEITAS